MGDDSNPSAQKNDRRNFERPRQSMWDQAISNEFFCRARQWRDVAEFERKELLKVRVYKSLKLTSRAILVVTMNIIFLSVIDVEFYYSRFGELITPRRLYPTVTHPAGVFAPCHFNQTSAQPIMMSFSYFTRSLILFLTLCNMWLIWWYTELERRLLVARHHLQEQSSLLLGPLTTNLMIELVLNALHVPPFPSPWPAEVQLFSFLKLYHIVKFMREHHPMRYNRMTEILKVVACVKLSKTFLIKSYFLQKPLPVLTVIYLFNVLAVGYIVFALERVYGSCMEYRDTIWLIGVTLTNLGYGDFTPYFGLSRLIISILSLSGIVLTALIVGVLSEALQIPTEEKRVLVSMEHQRSDKIRQHAAAQLIQSAWKQFRFDVELQNKRMSIGNIVDNSFTEKIKFRYNSMFQQRNLTQKFADSLWRWRKIKAQTDQLRASMEKEFIQENTALETRFISQKLDELEKIVKIGPTTQEDKLARHNTYSEVDFLLQRRSSGKKSAKRTSDRWMRAVQKAKSQKEKSDSTEKINGVKRSSSAYLQDPRKDQLEINSSVGRRLSLANPLLPKIDVVVSQAELKDGHVQEKIKSNSAVCLMRRNSFQSQSTLNARRKSRVSVHDSSIHETVEEEKAPSNSSSINVFLDRLQERQESFQSEMRSEISRLSEILTKQMLDKASNFRMIDDPPDN